MDTTPPYDTAILQCPCCGGQPLVASGSSIDCRACGRQYPVVDGIPQLLAEDSPRTKLVDIDYDQLHYINENSRNGIYKSWSTVFAELGVPFGDVLELGAGTGQLTWSLAHRFPFRSFHATDISPQFLRATADLVGDSPVAAHYCVCDANHLPYRDGSFDLVVGNSVLHHFLDYPLILRRLHGLLRPGGSAIFYEPVLQGKVLVAFLANLLLRIEKNTGLAGLSEEDLQKIQHFTQHLTKAKRIGNDREKLASMEDKYIFDIHAMRELGLQCGYRSSTYRNNPLFDDNFRINLGTHLERAGVEYPKISKYRFLLNAFQENLVDFIPRDMVTPMGYFIFTR